MPNTVLKPFKTVNRRFNTGDVVTAADIDPGSAYSLEDWIARGFVKSDSPAPSKKFTAPAPAPAPETAAS